MTPWTIVVVAAVAALQASGSPPGDLVVMQVRADPDTVLVGEHFRLTATVRIPPRHTLFFPDTLAPVGYLETRVKAAWELAGSRGDTAEVTVSYTLGAYRPGPTVLPSIPFVLRGRVPARVEAARALPGGSAIGFWQDLPRVPDFSYVRVVVPGEEVYVAPTLLPFDVMEGAAPRVAADVAGASWSAPLLAVAGLLAFALAGFLVVGVRWGMDEVRARETNAARGSTGSTAAARERALRELDRVRTLGLHTRGAADEFYARSSDAVRRYVETFEPVWGTAWTTSELMDAVREGFPDASIAPLAQVMLGAEAVKFGGRNPEPYRAEEDWTVLRDWVEATGRLDGTGSKGTLGP